MFRRSKISPLVKLLKRKPVTSPEVKMIKKPVTSPEVKMIKNPVGNQVRNPVPKDDGIETWLIILLVVVVVVIFAAGAYMYLRPSYTNLDNDMEEIEDVISRLQPEVVESKVVESD